MRTYFCISLDTGMRLLLRFMLWFERKQRTLVARLIQKTVCILCPGDNLQNGATLTQKRSYDALVLNISHYFSFLYVQKVFSSLHIVTIEPLMADGLPWQCFSYFSGSWQCKLLGSQWDSHNYKPPGLHPKYLKLCSEDERSFHGSGTTWG